MVIIRRQVNPSLDAWQIRSSQRMGCPFICLINSEPLSIFNHQKGNEINNLMMPAPTQHTHTCTHKTILIRKCPFIAAVIMSKWKGIYSDIWSNYYLWYIRKQGAFFLFDAGIPFSQFPFSLLCRVPVKSHSAAWVHTVPERSGPVISQLPYLRPKFTVQGLCVPLYSPCGSAPPLLSLTRIASILALVKLTSSLNYANKAVVICICTVWWHEALGVGTARKKRRNLRRGGAGRGIMGGIYSCGEGS